MHDGALLNGLKHLGGCFKIVAPDRFESNEHDCLLLEFGFNAQYSSSCTWASWKLASGL